MRPLRRASRGAAAACGFSLIELMVSLVLGLLLAAGALSIFLSARASFRTTEDLSRVQESSRVAFELLARDVREAGGNHCASSIRLANVVAERDDAYWRNWPSGFSGVGGGSAFAAPAFGFGSGAGARVAGTDGLELHSTEDLGLYLTAPMASATAELPVNRPPADVRAGDVLMVCDFRLASLFRATGVSANALAHGSGAGANCSAGFSRELALLCRDDSLVPAAAWHRYGANAVVTRPRMLRWFVGYNDRGGRSLYRAVLYSGAAQPAADEVAEGVVQMSLSYLAEGQASYQAAAAVSDWSRVKAVRVELTLQSERASAIDNQPLTRTVSTVLALRNRNS